MRYSPAPPQGSCSGPYEAIAIYERVDAHPHSRLMRAWELDRAFYAEALLRKGRAGDAKKVCEETIAVRRKQDTSAFSLRLPAQVLARAEAKLGNFVRAKKLLAELGPS